VLQEYKICFLYINKLSLKSHTKLRYYEHAVDDIPELLKEKTFKGSIINEKSKGFLYI